MNAYTTNRNTTLAAILVATVASLVSNGLALDQRLIYERDVGAVAGKPVNGFVLPEVVVTAGRLES